MGRASPGGRLKTAAASRRRQLKRDCEIPEKLASFISLDFIGRLGGGRGAEEEEGRRDDRPRFQFLVGDPQAASLGAMCTPLPGVQSWQLTLQPHLGLSASLQPIDSGSLHCCSACCTLDGPPERVPSFHFHALRAPSPRRADQSWRSLNRTFAPTTKRLAARAHPNFAGCGPANTPGLTAPAWRVHSCRQP